MRKIQQPIVQQTRWRDPLCPYGELRSTRHSTLAYKKHSHSQLSLGYVESGETLTFYQGKEWKLQQGDLVLIEPEKVHSCNPATEQGRSYCMLYLDKRWCLQQLSLLYAQPVTDFFCERVVFQDVALATNMQSLINSIQYNQQGKWLIEQIAMHVLSAYCTINTIPDQVSPLVINVREHLLKQIENPDSLADIGLQFSQSPETIIRAFTKQLAISPKAYLTNVRIEKSKTLLKQGISIIDTALQLGFSDQSHFHKTFKNYCAMTPKQYQQVNFIQ